MIVAAVAVAGLTATAANAADNGKLQLQINQLKAQQTQLQQQVANLQGQGQTAGAVHVGPVGGELISANEFNGRGLDLLKSLAKAGNNAPLLTIGGTLEADVQYNRQGTTGEDPAGLKYKTNASGGTNSSSAAYLDTARLDVLAHINDWVNGEISYDLNGSGSNLHTGSLLIGNLNQLPVYGQIGKFYPDAGLFGLASDDVYASSLVKYYFRPGAQNGVSVGFYKAGLHTALTAFKTSTTVTPSNIANGNQATGNWAAQADYTFNAGQVNATVGAGYVSNIVATNDNLAVTGSDSNDRLPMANISGKVGIGPFDILATYAQTLKSVKHTDSTNSKLKAFDVEGAYHFQMIKPMTVMLGYSRTYNFDKLSAIDFGTAADGSAAGAAGLGKKDQWLLGVNSEVFKNTTVGLEYARVSQFNNTTNSDVSHYNVLTADMTVKF